ncbi:MAG: protein-L-isoaspartate(D-aspartate) O-methyltransferase [Rhodocyclaceae bacterium]|nr:protein-L-isoaspartate(D-aspartate) O-methyltransferase [Rhodocyclaceae bacterium]
MKRDFRWNLAGLLALLTIGMASAEEMAGKRQAMVAEVAQMARTFATPVSQTVLDVLLRVPRHDFVPPWLKEAAYENRPLPIGHGQTISQPYIVAVMSELAQVKAGASALEIGTGSGYQAAILAELGARVYTLEIIPPLAQEAHARLRRLGYGDRVEVRIADGYFGWPEKGPFDAIVVTAAASHVPPPLVAQLKPGGRMVIPVGAPFQTQQLLLIEKLPDGRVHSRQLMPVRFVPLVGGS